MTRDVIRGHMNHMIIIVTLNSFTEYRKVIAKNNAFFIAAAYVKDTADATDWGTGITMGVLFAFLLMSPSVQVRVVARRTMASAGKQKITWSCAKYVAVISTHQFSIWEKGNG